jgi:ribosomal protein S18 acetylase RimI-like enzyme
MAPPFEYTYFRVARADGSILTAAKKYKKLRLSALQLSPTSFCSTYDIESAFTNATWVSRLKEHGRETFICAATPLGNDSKSDSSKPSGEEWVAQVTLLSPQSKAAFILPPESGQPMPMSDEEEERWQMLSLYTLPSHRGKGVAKKLCQHALAHLKLCRSSLKVVRVRLMVKPENQATFNLYRQLDFADAGKCTLTEALKANGDHKLIPNEQGDDRYNARTGLIMMVSIIRND